MKKLLLASLTLALITTNIVAGEANKAYDVGNFDVAGIKLGMTMNEAVTAFTKKYNINKSLIKFNKPLNPDPITNDREPTSFIYLFDANGGNYVAVDTESKIPPDKNNSKIVIKIVYATPSTKDNQKIMLDAAIEKYGSPSELQYNGTKKWCLELDPNRTDRCLNQSYTKGPELSLDDRNLTLRDFSYFKTRDNYLEKKKTIKPAF